MPSALAPPSRSNSSSSHGTVHSLTSPFVSSAYKTLFPEPKSYPVDELPRYVDEDRSYSKDRKALSSSPYSKGRDVKKSYSTDGIEPYQVDHPVAHPYSSSFSSLPQGYTSASQLAYALGPDNTPHTTEIDTMPCAGIRIPHGTLTGLLAWRLVVRVPPPTKGKRGWWNDTQGAVKRRRSFLIPSLPPNTTASSHNHSASLSALSLPYKPQEEATSPWTAHDTRRPSSVILARQPRTAPSKGTTQDHPKASPPTTGIITNFVLDTSLPYSIISRDTLIALGYPTHLSSAPSAGTHSTVENSGGSTDTPAVVTLVIQGIPTRFYIGRPGEAGRLGVQFLHDAGVSIFFAKDGDGIGPVLHVESDRFLNGAPSTVPLKSQKVGAKTLQQIVKGIFGL